ncbi:MAG: serine acetyltransferase [Planctomycetota bacterium]
MGRQINLEHYDLGVVMHPNGTIADWVPIFHDVIIDGEMPIDEPERVLIGDGVTLGVNAIVLPRPYQGLAIGAGAKIGAGAVFSKDVPLGVTVVGVPAKLIREHSEINAKSYCIGSDE